MTLGVGIRTVSMTLSMKMTLDGSVADVSAVSMILGVEMTWNGSVVDVRTLGWVGTTLD